MDGTDNFGIWWLGVEQRTMYDQDDENVLRCVAADTAEEAVECYPCQVARPWEYDSEISGPRSVRLKKAVLYRDAALKERGSGAVADDRHAIWSILAAAVIGVIIYCMERFLEQQYAGKNWYVFTALFLFLAMIVDLCYLFLAHVEMDLYGIGVAIVVTVLYVKFMKKMPVFIGAMVLCLAGCLYFLADIARIRRMHARNLKEREDEVSAASDGLLMALKGNVNAFADEWAAISDEAAVIWHEAARRVCAGLDSAWKDIAGWKIDSGEADLSLIPVWKNANEKHDMWAHAESIWWANLDPDSPEEYGKLMRKGIKSEKDLELLTSIAEKGYLEAIIDLTIQYFNSGTVKQDRLMAMLWASVGYGISTCARLLDALGEYRFFDVRPAEPDDCNASYLLGECWDAGNALFEPDDRKAQDMMNYAALEGSSRASRWLAERGLKLKMPFN